mmetsp:Transcript_112277/g.322779  ORF Transcript_112277/g.322779 Transcript_112277/m.322779 type:complete len:214 (-) Transcript_112277:794-1435(-)
MRRCAQTTVGECAISLQSRAVWSALVCGIHIAERGALTASVVEGLAVCPPQARVLVTQVQALGDHAVLIHGLDHVVGHDHVAAAVGVAAVQGLEDDDVHGEGDVNKMGVRLGLDLGLHRGVDVIVAFQCFAADSNQLGIGVACENQHYDLGVLLVDRANRALQVLGRDVRRVHDVGHFAATVTLVRAVQRIPAVVHEVGEDDDVGAADSFRDG